MTRTGDLVVLHLVTQWLWLSDSFVHGPIAHARHRPIVISRMPLINTDVYAPPADLHCLDDGETLVEEGAATAAWIASAVAPARPDVVHLHHGYGLPDAAATARLLGIPLVASFWGFDVTALPAREPARILDHLDAVDAAVVPSKFLAGVVRELGVGAADIHVIPGSVDPGYFRPTAQPREPRVAFVGRFVAKKGIATLMAAWPKVRQAVPDAELVLLGYGDLPSDTVGRPGVRVVSPDPRDPRGQVRDVLRWCRVYVSPSTTGPDGDSESQHIGNVEAQASARAVLTTDHGAIPEFVEHDVSGVVVPNGNSTALATALISLLADPERCAELGRNGVLRALDLDVDKNAGRHRALYSQVVDGAP